MKGPGLRIALDVRRLWRCPRCGGERRAAANVTSLTCTCAPEHPRMRLIEGQRRVRPEPKPLDLVLDIDLDAPDTESAAETLTPSAKAPAAIEPPVPQAAPATEPDDFAAGLTDRSPTSDPPPEQAEL